MASPIRAYICDGLRFDPGQLSYDGDEDRELIRQIFTIDWMRDLGDRNFCFDPRWSEEELTDEAMAMIQEYREGAKIAEQELHEQDVLTADEEEAQ
jgi:hypothetical protein